MNKHRNKNYNYNNAVIDELRAKYGFTRNYIIMSIRGDRTGTFPTKIADEYKQLDRAARQAIKSKIENL